MLPLEITDAARSATNTRGSNFVTDSELLGYLSYALRELSHYSRCYETTDVYTSVASQATYPITAAAFEIKYIRYDNTKIHPVTMREADAAGYLLQDTNSYGVPTYYYRWGNDLVLTPTPSASDLEIKIYSYATHPTVTASSVIYIPETLQHYCIDYIEYRILGKEQNPRSEQVKARWEANLEKARREMFQRNRSDGFRTVQSEEVLIYDPFGIT